MSESRNKERMNTIFQESKLRGLSEPGPGIDQCGNYTLTWISDSTEIVVIFTPGVHLAVTYPDATLNAIVTIKYGCGGMNDSEVIDRVEQEIAKAAA